MHLGQGARIIKETVLESLGGWSVALCTSLISGLQGSFGCREAGWREARGRSSHQQHQPTANNQQEKRKAGIGSGPIDTRSSAGACVPLVSFRLV